MTKTIEHAGVIESVSDKMATVKIEQTSACAGCHAKSACGASDRAEKKIDAYLTDSTLRVGDRVVVYGAKSLGLKSVLWAFVLPFTLILITIMIMVECGVSETLSGVIGLCALLPYYFVLWLLRDRMKSTFQFYVRHL